MAKLNLLLLAVLVACALGLVTSQHKARKLFSELEREQTARASSTSSTAACSSRRAPGACIRAWRSIAVGTLGLRAPDPRRVRLVAARRRAVTGAVGAAAQGLVRLPVWRARFVLAALLAALRALLAARAVYLQALKTDFLQEKGDARYSRVLEMPATRGRILDRNGEALAVSTPVKSIWAIPADVELEARPQRASSPRCSRMQRRELDKQARRRRAISSTSSARSPPETADGDRRSSALHGHLRAARIPPLLSRPAK